MNPARDFANRLADLLRKERQAMAAFLIQLAEFDRRKLYRDLGHASLFSFLTVDLKLSAGAAQHRKTAVELIQKFSSVEAALEDGRLCLSSVIEVAKVLTPDNEAEVLPRFFRLSSRKAAFVAAAIHPVENAPRREVYVPPRPAAPAESTREVSTILDSVPLLAFQAPEVASCIGVETPTPRDLPPPLPCPPEPLHANPPARSTFRPLDAEHGRLHLTVSMSLHQKLEAAKNGQPWATTEQILETALDALLEKRAKRKGLGVKPRKTRRPAAPATWTAELTRALFERSGGRCEWIFESGERCNSPVLPERDHVQPRGRGGPTTLENARICCKPHNLLAARQVYGDEWMDKFTKKRRPEDPEGSR